MHQMIHILLVLVVLQIIHQVLYSYNYRMILTNTSNISIIFEFITVRNNQINVNTTSDTAIFIIIASIEIMFWSFISHINTICEASKKLRKIAIRQQEQMQLAMNENYRNLPNSYSRDNAYNTQYVLHPIEAMNTEIEGYYVMVMIYNKVMIGSL